MKLTAEQRAAIIASAVAGDCHEGIAAEIGCSRRAVSRIVKASGVVVRPPRPVPSPEDARRLEARLEAHNKKLAMLLAQEEASR